MNENFLVIDVGTQSLRASVVSSSGQILVFSRQKYEVPYFSPEKGSSSLRIRPRDTASKAKHMAAFSASYAMLSPPVSLTAFR